MKCYNEWNKNSLSKLTEMRAEELMNKRSNINSQQESKKTGRKYMFCWTQKYN